MLPQSAEKKTEIRGTVVQPECKIKSYHLNSSARQCLKHCFRMYSKTLILMRQKKMVRTSYLFRSS